MIFPPISSKARAPRSSQRLPGCRVRKLALRDDHIDGYMTRRSRSPPPPPSPRMQSACRFRPVHRPLHASAASTAPLAYATAYSVFGLARALAPRCPHNAGSLSAYSVTAPRPIRSSTPWPPAPVASRHTHRPDAAGRGLRRPAPGDTRPRSSRGHLLRTLSHDLPYPRRRGRSAASAISGRH